MPDHPRPASFGTAPSPAITRTPGIQCGDPCIAGTRVTTAAIWSFWVAGYSLDKIQAEYPSLTTEQIHVAIEYERDAAPPRLAAFSRDRVARHHATLVARSSMGDRLIFRDEGGALSAVHSTNPHFWEQVAREAEALAYAQRRDLRDLRDRIAAAAGMAPSDDGEAA